MSFAAIAQSAAALIASNGASVTFTSTTATYSETDDTSGSVTANSVSGVAVRVGNDPKQFAALSLIESSAVTLLFAGSAYPPTLPSLGMSVTWGSVAYIVKAVTPVDPDGAGAIVARVVCAKVGR